ncbi:hypothetical protein C7399_1416 [Paraburkholderia tropica]|uniref:Guanylate cyclase domain-containing protein n=1 Tax=Paraburkholderia tropica TaxID=92647 RepID=A0ABX5MDD1_9BURK|nr:hypothetical protein [Paraburkholderia tropica]PXX05443.1 hypothetical protein C7400_1416 [Paraburkholderia tropica]PZW70706.1 hypothetical protein C7399_1416 [Paraburkholderia tropica]
MSDNNENGSTPVADGAEPRAASLQPAPDSSFELSSIKIPPSDEGPGDPPTDVDYPKDVAYEDRVVAFVDILGFRDIIARSAGEPELVQKIYTALDVRKDNWAKAFAAEVGLKMEPKDFGDRFHSFSDCIVISVRPDIREVGLLVWIIFKICRQLLRYGFTSRGGVAVGKLFHRDTIDAESAAPPMVFGPAFNEAYGFESAHADGPRIIFQSKVWRLIEDNKNHHPDTKLRQFFDEHLSRAEDGPAFVNLFADFGHNTYYETAISPENEIALIGGHIRTALDQTSDRPHHFKKHAFLAREFNRSAAENERQDHCIPPDILPRRTSS